MDKSWQDELRDKFEGANDLSSSNGIDGLIAFIQSILDKKAEEIEASKKERLYHWRNFGDIDGSNEYSEGIVENHKDAPDVADGSSCEFVWNQALDQAISILKEEE